jgi:hypothetical protein
MAVLDSLKMPRSEQKCLYSDKLLLQLKSYKTATVKAGEVRVNIDIRLINGDI